MQSHIIYAVKNAPWAMGQNAWYGTVTKLLNGWLLSARLTLPTLVFLSPELHGLLIFTSGPWEFYLGHWSYRGAMGLTEPKHLWCDLMWGDKLISPVTYLFSHISVTVRLGGRWMKLPVWWSCRCMLAFSSAAEPEVCPVWQLVCPHTLDSAGDFGPVQDTSTSTGQNTMKL